MNPTNLMEFKKEVFFDKFSNAAHRLIYFDWKPQNVQQKMF